MFTIPANLKTDRKLVLKLPLDSRLLKEKSVVHPFANLISLGFDYGCLLVLITGAVAFDMWRVGHGLPWGWTAFVWTACTPLIGAVQHRIALMGHEASHHLLHPDRAWNDRLAELLCFYPLFGTIEKYRAKHLGHHLYPNHPEKDPNLGGGKLEKIYAAFPMPKHRFLRLFCLGIFWPPFVLGNLVDLVRVVLIGRKPLMEQGDPSPAGKKSPVFVLGLLYVVVLTFSLRLSHSIGLSTEALLGLVFLTGLAVWSVLPGRFFSGSGPSIRSSKLAGLSRLTYYTILFGSMGLVYSHMGYNCSPAFLALWIFPLIYLFPYFMLVRELFQHANAGQGKIENSRIMHVGPFTRWAVLGYGNDFHLIHHIYPNIPCYRLREVHDLLVQRSPEYRRAVKETHGISQTPSASGKRSLLDDLARDPQRQVASSANAKPQSGALPSSPASGKRF